MDPVMEAVGVLSTLFGVLTGMHWMYLHTPVRTWVHHQPPAGSPSQQAVGYTSSHPLPEDASPTMSRVVASPPVDQYATWNITQSPQAPARTVLDPREYWGDRLRYTPTRRKRSILWRLFEAMLTVAAGILALPTVFLGGSIVGLALMGEYELRARFDAFREENANRSLSSLAEEAYGLSWISVPSMSTILFWGVLCTSAYFMTGEYFNLTHDKALRVLSRLTFFGAILWIVVIGTSGA
jgi:uncharacterized iron-regulated membrane protein